VDYPRAAIDGGLGLTARSEAGLRRHDATGVGRLIGYYGTQAWFAGMATWCVYLTRDFWGI
jgi:hypothetical protein